VAVSGAEIPPGPDAEPVTRGPRQLLRSSVVVAVGTGLSRLSGFARTAVLAWVLGATALAEAYNLANNTPNLLYDLVLGGVLSATLVPVVVELTDKDDRDGIDAIATVVSVILVVATVLTMVAAPLVIRLYNVTAPSGQAAEQARLAVPLLVLFAPQILFYGLTTLFTALLNARRAFAAAAFAPVLNNVVVICVFLALPRLADSDLTFTSVLADRWLLLLIGAGTTAGIVAMTLVLLPALRHNHIRLQWRFAPRDPAVRRIARLSGWTFAYVLVNLIGYGIVQILANGVGGVTIYAYAWMFFQLPYGLWTVSVMTTHLPEMAQDWTRGLMDSFRTRLDSGLRLVLVVVLPASIGLILLSGPIVGLVFEHGQFTDAAADTTANTVTAFLFGLPGFSLLLYAFRCFYAQRDTRIPFLVNLVETIAAVGLSIVMVDRYGVVGLAAANSIAISVFALVALVMLHRRVGRYMSRDGLVDLVKMLVAAGVMAIVVVLVVRLASGGDLVSLVLGGVVGVLVYAGLLTAMGTDETRLVLARLRRRS
jgi:putative peptidoglycan lipid II flippase